MPASASQLCAWPLLVCTFACDIHAHLYVLDVLQIVCACYVSISARILCVDEYVYVCVNVSGTCGHMWL